MILIRIKIWYKVFYKVLSLLGGVSFFNWKGLTQWSAPNGTKIRDIFLLKSPRRARFTRSVDPLFQRGLINLEISDDSVI